MYPHPHHKLPEAHQKQSEAWVIANTRLTTHRLNCIGLQCNNRHVGIMTAMFNTNWMGILCRPKHVIMLFVSAFGLRNTNKVINALRSRVERLSIAKLVSPVAVGTSRLVGGHRAAPSLVDCAQAAETAAVCRQSRGPAADILCSCSANTSPASTCTTTSITVLLYTVQTRELL